MRKIALIALTSLGLLFVAAGAQAGGGGGGCSYGGHLKTTKGVEKASPVETQTATPASPVIKGQG
jgi:hypothetical protein